MKRILSLTIISLLASTALAETRSATYMPEGGYLSTTNATYVEPSATTAITPGQKIGDLTKRNFAGETVVQRLTDHSYWIQTGFYSTVAYVGDEGVLLMDPLGADSGAKVLAAIKGITDKPVTAVVYSHQHEDHIGGINAFVDAAKAEGRELRIITADKTAEAMEKSSKLPKATEILTADKNTATFEKETLTVTQMGKHAHSGDSAIWKLTGENIAHVPDYVNPDQMPFLNFGGSQTFVGFEDDLRQLKDIGFTFLSSGHGNIGTPEDVDFMLTYTEDLKAALGKAFGEVNYGDFAKPEANNHMAVAGGYYDAVEAAAMETLRPKYGDFYGFDASVPDQIRMVRESHE